EGNFVVAWTSNGSGGTDTDGMSIQARRYDALGNPLGGEFQVNTYTTGYQLRPALAVDGQGSFVVAWASFGSSGTDTDGYSIQAQRYDQNGAPVGGQFQVNTYTPYFQDESAIAADGSGGFVIARTSDGSSGTDTDRYSIQAQRYDLNGALVGDQFQVNTYTTSWQLESAVAADGEGNFVVAWTSYGSGSADTDGTSIQAQRYDALFRDGVESGDTARWSATVP
ncbi:MAG TPA: hypothetical protein VLA66_01425, partial [Thermoanaerobaculia bacterium]|nr:hypothetical protein [Thermoanaerobaculia bacterium]